MANVVEYNGIDLLNKSGTYTYYESDYNNACILIELLFQKVNY